MQRLNHKMSTSALKERFSRHDRQGQGLIGFDDFSSLLAELAFDAGVFRDQVADFLF